MHGMFMVALQLVDTSDRLRYCLDIACVFVLLYAARDKLTVAYIMLGLGAKPDVANNCSARNASW